MRICRALLIVFLAISSMSWAETGDQLDQSRPVVSGEVDYVDLAKRNVLISDRLYHFSEVVRLNGKLVSGATVPGVLRKGMSVKLQMKDGARSVVDVLRYTRNRN